MNPANAPQKDHKEQHQDPLAVLGLGPNATPEEIKAAYKKKAAETHPRKQIEELKKAKKQFTDVNRAYYQLTHPKKDKEAHKEEAHHGTHEHAHGHPHFHPLIIFKDNYRNGLWDVADFGLTKELEHNLFHFDDPFFNDDFFRQEPHKVEGEKPEFHSKVINSHVFLENGKKKKVTTKICNENGQIKQETKEEEWDDQGHYNSRILPGSTPHAVEHKAEKPAIEKKEEHKEDKPAIEKKEEVKPADEKKEEHKEEKKEEPKKDA